MDNNLWLFDYDKGIAYEEFSKCEDSDEVIFYYLNTKYDLQNKTILEVGAGSGKFTAFLAEKNSKLLVVEKSAPLMQINKNKNSTYNNITFILSDIKDVVIDDDSIDFIFLGWSLTSMRNIFNSVFRKFQKMLKSEGKIILIENGGNDEFCKLMGIETFTKEMRRIYKDFGFVEKQLIKTTIKLPNTTVFYDAFPNKRNTTLKSLIIKHNVLVLEMGAAELMQINTKG